MKAQSKNLKIEFTSVWGSKSSLASLLLGLGATPFGCYNQHENTIFIFLDQICQASVFAPDDTVDWVAQTISRVVVHELLHALEPSLPEESIVWAEDAVFGHFDLPDEIDWEEEFWREILDE